VECDATCTYESAPINDVSERIAAAAVDLLPRAPTVQLGIGSIPEAVAAALGEAGLGRLRMVGMACDRFCETDQLQGETLDARRGTQIGFKRPHF